MKNIKNLKKKKTLSKYDQQKAKIKDYDNTIGWTGDCAQQAARKQAVIIFEVLNENLVKTIRDGNERIIGFEFSPQVTRDIEKNRPKDKSERDDLLVATPFLRGVMAANDGRKRDQKYWNRQMRYGYSYIYALEYKWEIEDYREHVMQHGYSGLAEKGRKLLGINSADEFLDGEEGEEEEVRENNASNASHHNEEVRESDSSRQNSATSTHSKGVQAEGDAEDDEDDIDSTKGAASSNEGEATDKSGYTTKEKLEAFGEWRRCQKRIGTADMTSLSEAFQKDEEAVGLALIVHGKDKELADVIPVKTGFADEVDQIMARIGEKYRNSASYRSNAEREKRKSRKAAIKQRKAMKARTAAA